MRPGLVLVGAALVVLGSSAAVAISVLPPSTTSTGYTYQLSLYSAANQTRATLVPGEGGNSASLLINWSATAAFSVELYPTGQCPVAAPSCATGPALASWPGNLSGTQTLHGALSYPYLLVWTASPASGGLFAISCQSQVSVTTPLPGVVSVVVYASAAVLVVLGAVAAFLGLFLRGGFRSRLREPPPSSLREPPPGRH